MTKSEITPRALYWIWVRTVTLGEFLGFLVPSIVGVLSVVLNVSPLLQMAMMICAGLGEGAVLGYFQSKVLGRHIADFVSTRWIRITMLAAGFAWLIGMLPSTIGEGMMDISLWLLVPVGCVLAGLLLFSIGYAQYTVLRHHVAGAWKWIWINVLAWLGGLTAVFTVMFSAPEGVLPTIVFSALGGLSMAFAMAFITGRHAVRAMLHKSL